jgi:hypothetical protein
VLVGFDGAHVNSAAAAVAAAVLAKQCCTLKEHAAATENLRDSKEYVEATKCMLEWTNVLYVAV